MIQDIVLKWSLNPVTWGEFYKFRFPEPITDPLWKCGQWLEICSKVWKLLVKISLIYDIPDNGLSGFCLYIFSDGNSLALDSASHIFNTEQCWILFLSVQRSVLLSSIYLTISQKQESLKPYFQYFFVIKDLDLTQISPIKCICMKFEGRIEEESYLWQ